MNAVVKRVAVLFVASAAVVATSSGCSLLGDSGSAPSSTASSSASSSAPPSTNRSTSSATTTTTTSSTPASSSATPASAPPTAGIVTLSTVGTKKTYGVIDPSSGQYSVVASFPVVSGDTNSFQNLAVSPDFTKYAVERQVGGKSSVGWIDGQGAYTNVTPAVAIGPFGGTPPVYSVVGFDAAGDFYYREMAGGLHPNMYELAPGSTSNPQEITTAAAQAGEFTAYLNYDGTMQFGCNSPLSWLGPHATTFASSHDIVKHENITFDAHGCVTGGKEVQLLPASNKAGVSNAVGKADGTAVAFKYDDRDLPGSDVANNNGASLYVVAADGGSQPTEVKTPSLSIKDMAFMTLLKWI